MEICINNKTKTSARYAYDALGRRIEARSFADGQVDAVRRYWYNDLTQGLWSQAYMGLSLSRNYIYGNYIDEVLGIEWVIDEIPWGWYYYLHDHLYSPAAMLADYGIVERYEYDAYGRREVMTPGFVHRSNSHYLSDIGLTGREIDELDLDAAATPRLQHMHYRHRDYNLQLGRFMQQDPIDLLFLQKFAGISVVPNHIIVKIMVGYSHENMAERSGWINFSRLVSIYRAYQEEGVIKLSLWHSLMGFDSNLYQYVGSSPLNYIDPSGLCADGITRCSESCDRIPIGNPNVIRKCINCCFKANPPKGPCADKAGANCAIQAIGKSPITPPGGVGPKPTPPSGNAHNLVLFQVFLTSVVLMKSVKIRKRIR